jgi:hypothetical protein
MTVSCQNPVAGDVHAQVVGRLNDHLAAMSRLRDELTCARAIPPGLRLSIAMATAAAAEEYAREITATLGV